MAHHKRDRSNGVDELLKANIALFVWLVFLAFGGGLLALYYARIGYLPDIEWKSTIVYLAATTIIGGVVGLLFALSLFAPGFIWSEFLIFDARLKGVFCLDTIRNEPCVQTILYKMGWQFGLILFISHLSLPFGTKIFPSRFGSWVYLGLATVILLATFFLMKKYIFKPLVEGLDMADGNESQEERSRKGQEGAAENKPEPVRRTFKYAFWFTLSVALSQISMLLMYVLSRRPDEWNFYKLTAICTIGVLISNHVVAIRYHRHKLQALAAALVAAFLLLFTADRFSSLSQQMMALYGFGGGQRVNLVVNGNGAGIINTLGLSNTCSPASPDKVCSVEVLSKMGDEYYLRRPDCRTFTLPKSDVRSLESAGEFDQSMITKCK
jgi:hypothetical protein